MKNYLELLKEIMEDGVRKESRAGNTISVCGAMLKWNLSNGFPILTTRKISPRIAFEETMMFLRGETNTKTLVDKNINIWKGNTSREFLDNAGLGYLPEGSIGTGYSHQWRNFGGTLGMSDGVDQIAELLEGLKANPSSRRHLVSAWNPTQLSGTPLPPCHIMQMYSVNGNKLDSSFVMRSNDVPFGLPFNIMGYAILNIIFAKYLDLDPGTLVYYAHDAHIYENQIPMIEEQITRTPKELPTLNITKELNSLDDILSLEYTDLELVGYEAHPDIKNKPTMAI